MLRCFPALLPRIPEQIPPRDSVSGRSCAVSPRLGVAVFFVIEKCRHVGWNMVKPMNMRDLW